MTKRTTALYARASGAFADHSLAAQIDGCRRLALSLGCENGETFIAPARPAISGGGAALGQLLEACAQARFDTIVTALCDRISRNPETLHHALKQLTESPHQLAVPSRAGRFHRRPDLTIIEGAAASTDVIMLRGGGK